MRVCVVVFKPSWQRGDGTWESTGGFPLQMRAIASLFDQTTLVVARAPVPGTGGLPLPEAVRVVALDDPPGTGARRRMGLARRLPHYLGALVREIRPAEAVHVAVPGDMDVIAMVIALVLRKRLIARYSGSWERNAQTSSANRIVQWLMRRFAGGRNVMLATGDGAVPPAPGMHWLFASALSEREIRTIPLQEGHGLSNPPTCCYIGRLSPEKGVDVLLRALSALEEQGFEPMPFVRIVGDGPARAGLERLAGELGIERRLSFEGQLDRDRLSRRVADADFCIQPSRTEGFSKAWLDAFAHGLPVLASEVGAARAVIGGDGLRGWLVPPDDPAALAAMLRRILGTETDWESLRRRCREYVEGRTIEAWGSTIGAIAARQWGVPLRRVREREERGA